MLRLALTRNFQFFTKKLTTNVDQTVQINRIISPLVQTVNSHRLFSITTTRFCEANEEKAEGESEETPTEHVHPLFKKYAGTPRDRSKIIPFQTSIEYIKSPAYEATYGGKLVWELYRRIHKGQLPKARTRKTCIRGNVVKVGSPCPICRDEYLVLDYRNLELLKQFISPHTGEVSHSYQHFTQTIHGTNSTVFFSVSFADFILSKNRPVPETTQKIGSKRDPCLRPGFARIRSSSP